MEAAITTNHPRADHFEQSGDEIWLKCGEAVREALQRAQVRPEDVKVTPPTRSSSHQALRALRSMRHVRCTIYRLLMHRIFFFFYAVDRSSRDVFFVADESL